MLKSWISALRLRTLPLAAAGIGTGGFLAAKAKQFDPLIFGLCLLTALLLQTLSNLANDYGDSINGADNPDRKGPVRAVQSGAISPNSMKKAVILCAALAFLAGILLLYYAVSLQHAGLFIGFFTAGLLAVWAAVRYTAGKKPYGYIGLGDIFVFIFFGPVAVIGAFYLQTKLFDPALLLPAATLGLFSVAVLNLNNIRDIESDKAAGKHTIPVRIGLAAAKNYHTLLIAGAFMGMAAYTIITFHHTVQWLFLLTLPLFILIDSQLRRKQTPLLTDKLLKYTALSVPLFVINLGIGWLWYN